MSQYLYLIIFFVIGDTSAYTLSLINLRVRFSSMPILALTGAKLMVFNELAKEKEIILRFIM